MMDQQQLEKVRDGNGFIAALDQSGGSTPKALRLYGVGEDQYADKDEMFDRIHEMRTRIITSPSFSGDRIVGAILFEMTMDRQIDRQDSGHYLWSVKHVVPFLKVDKGLTEEVNGVQLMKPIGGLDGLLERGVAKGMFGTKMRSVVKLADPKGIDAIVNQQFDVGLTILEAGLVPILEPEVDIKSPEKRSAEALLKAAILPRVDDLPSGQQVIFKLTLPEENGFYGDLVAHPRVMRVVALSGGYSRDQANDRLAHNPGVIASFSRALTEGLTAQQSDEEFDAVLDASINVACKGFELLLYDSDDLEDPRRSLPRAVSVSGSRGCRDLRDRDRRRADTRPRSADRRQRGSVACGRRPTRPRYRRRVARHRHVTVRHVVGDQLNFLLAPP